jgi:hypothetical protein
MKKRVILTFKSEYILEAKDDDSMNILDEWIEELDMKTSKISNLTGSIKRIRFEKKILNVDNNEILDILKH